MSEFDYRFSSSSLPLSPYEEGVVVGFAVEPRIMHFDGTDHRALDIPDEIHDDLAEQKDFIKGVCRGVFLSHQLSLMGFEVSKQPQEQTV